MTHRPLDVHIRHEHLRLQAQTHNSSNKLVSEADAPSGPHARGTLPTLGSHSDVVLRLVGGPPSPTR